MVDLSRITKNKTHKIHFEYIKLTDFRSNQRENQCVCNVINVRFDSKVTSYDWAAFMWKEKKKPIQSSVDIRWSERCFFYHWENRYQTNWNLIFFECFQYLIQIIRNVLHFVFMNLWTRKFLPSKLTLLTLKAKKKLEQKFYCVSFLNRIFVLF